MCSDVGKKKFFFKYKGDFETVKFFHKERLLLHMLKKPSTQDLMYEIGVLENRFLNFSY